jgi:tRNA-uridine 2-sulfurtransferase
VLTSELSSQLRNLSILANLKSSYMSNQQRVIVGLSGGVDSAVSAHLLKEQGYEVIGIFMKNWEDDDDSEFCSSNIDFVDAAAVADVVGVELEHVNFAADYKDRVFAEFVREYQAGRTPNPDILCNAEIKFKSFLDHAMRLGASKIATGHYARVRHNPATGLHELLKGLDTGKDQSYFLHRLNQAQLSKTLFPVGELHKTEVRRIAQEIGLPNAKKKDSTGICFIGERPFREFLNRYISKEPGPIKNDKGHTIGQHVGLSFYTLGQRQGLGIGGVKEKGAQRGGGDHAPWFVARKDMDKNILWVVQGHEHPWLQSGALHAADVSWCAGISPLGGAYGSKARYRQADAPCLLANSNEAGFDLSFPEAQWAVTPGQSAVLYDGEICLGGGVISSKVGI